ncbi:MAG: guanylate kinase [Bacteroidota bacterium]
MEKLLIFTAPSGAGKTTIVRHLLKTFPELDFSISATTRAARPREQHGRDYYFISPQDFAQRIEKEEFIEWEEFYGGLRYGTLRSEVTRLWAAGKAVVFDVEVKGATQLKAAFPAQSLAVFVKPPSPDILFERLRARQTESEDSLRKRIDRAAEELTYEDHFDQVLLNDDLAATLAEAEEIVRTFLDLDKV